VRTVAIVTYIAADRRLIESRLDLFTEERRWRKKTRTTRTCGSARRTAAYCYEYRRTIPIDRAVTKVAPLLFFLLLLLPLLRAALVPRDYTIVRAR